MCLGITDLSYVCMVQFDSETFIINYDEHYYYSGHFVLCPASCNLTCLLLLCWMCQFMILVRSQLTWCSQLVFFCFFVGYYLPSFPLKLPFCLSFKIPNLELKSTVVVVKASKGQTMSIVKMLKCFYYLVPMKFYYQHCCTKNYLFAYYLYIFYKSETALDMELWQLNWWFNLGGCVFMEILL